MAAELFVVVIVEAFDGGILDRAVHPFDLAIGPGVLDLGQAVLDPVLFAAHVEHVCDEGCGRAVGVARREGELDAIVSEDGVDLVGNRLDQRDEEGEAVIRLAFSSSRTKANLLVRSMATKRQSFPSAVCTSAMSMWK